MARSETRATLHYMVEKPDAGDLVAQTAVPILPDDTAKEVFDKVTVAAELTLHYALPALLAGTVQRIAQNLSRGCYFSGRKPGTGASTGTGRGAVHNLVRAVAPPYPGAFTVVAGQPARILGTQGGQGGHAGDGSRARTDRRPTGCALLPVVARCSFPRWRLPVNQ